jgi:hypothetical protein
MPKPKEKVKPVREFRIGRIRAAVWANQTDNGIRHNVTFSRPYKSDGGEWQDSTSFGRDDLLLLAKVADRVHSWIFEQTQEQNGLAESRVERFLCGRRFRRERGTAFLKVLEANSLHHRPHPSTNLAQPTLAGRPMPWATAARCRWCKGPC